jgi:lipocalin-like protein
MRADRAKYASSALWQGTPDENKETADGTITYFGTYSISEADSSIAIHVVGSSFPNWNGTDQKRLPEQLTLTVRSSAGDVVDVIWKRALMAQSVSLLGAMPRPELGVKPTSRLPAWTSWFDPGCVKTQKIET